MSVMFSVPTAAIILPNPDVGNSEIPIASFTKRRSQNNLMYTYVKKSSDYKHLLSFKLARPKSLEFYEFFTRFNASKLTYTDINNERWSGYLLTVPWDMSYLLGCGNCGYNTVSIEYQGAKL